MTRSPLLVFGPSSLGYDFGTFHPLTPRRFGPGIELLESVGARPGLEPAPASDEDLELVHSAAYVKAVRQASIEGRAAPQHAIEPGDNPPFVGMHTAAAAVAGGSLRAVEAILDGRVDHAFHPGGGLHHAMRDRAGGFCIYNDPALAIARARRAGRRVLYVDLDVHHGDGVQALHYADPGVLTVSIHETGRVLFPGTGFPDELGEGEAAGTSVNIPLEPGTSGSVWLAAVRSIVPALAAGFDPELIVSQHGADSHAWDPLAHLAVTTAEMGAAARLMDHLAHRHAAGAWLATGGGGYDVYRVVPRAWALTWLAAAHRPAPDRVSEVWRERWASDALRHGARSLPERFEDDPSEIVAQALNRSADERSTAVAARVRAIVVPALLRAAEERGWWDPLPGDPARPAREGPAGASSPTSPGPAGQAEPTLLDRLTLEHLDRARLAPRVIPPASTTAATALLRRALEDGARACGAMAGEWLVGIALLGGEDVLALGVAPAFRRRGLGSALLGRLANGPELAERTLRCLVTVAERDPIEPDPVDTRRAVALGLLERAGFVRRPVPPALAAIDRTAVAAEKPGRAAVPPAGRGTTTPRE